MTVLASQFTRLIGVMLACSLAGCVERISFGSLGGGASNSTPTEGTEPLAAAPTGPVASAPLATQGGPRTPPPVAMAGRWTLTAPGSGGCAMNFGAPAGAAEGTIAPEGGCPGNFYTSRKWTFQDGVLLIRDHTGAQLAQVTLVGPGRFEGKATTGAPITLAR